MLAAWTLRFRDDALEAEYAASFAREHRRMIRIAIVMGIVIWVGCAAFDDVSGGNATNGAWVTKVRLGLGTPLLAASAAFALFAPEARFARWWQAIGGLGAAGVFASMAIFVAFLPEPEAIDQLDGVWGVAITIIGIQLVCGLRFVTSFVIVGCYVLSVIATLLGRGIDQRGVIALFAVVSAASLGGFGAYFLERSRREVFVLRRKADRLLRNVLPGPIAERLQDREQRIAERFDAVTVLFGDLVGFTTMAQQLPPEEVVAKLDDIFSELDDIAERHGLEKIKTIGDAYMVVGGVPTPRADHAQAVAAMAIEMLAAAERRALKMRIGIHSGPVVAGVIGKQKFSYDLWGDTVNIASRMESHGVEGRVHCSEATRALLDGAFAIEPRGTISIKGKGEMQTFFVDRRV